MRLLIVTQKVDAADPILGFFHRWIEEFASHCEKVTVIGQSVGSHHFPGNVTVLSLGKEKGASRMGQVTRFWKHLRASDYDIVLVHMTPIWVVLGRLVTSKPFYLWYEARGARWPLKLAVMIVRKVFSASPHGMTVKTSKSVITGHGIDIQHFRPGESRDPHLLLTVGRITAAKRLPVIVDAFMKLPSPYRLLIAGHAITQADQRLKEKLPSDLRNKGIAGRVEMRSVTPDDILTNYQKASLFLHASDTSLDKALLEAMACGCLVVSCSRAASILPSECRADDHTLADRAKHLLSLSVHQQDGLRHQLREIVIREHSLSRLIERLVREMA